MKILVFLAALLCVAAARAQDRIVSVDAFQLGYTSGFVFKNDTGKGSTKDRDENNFKLNLNFAQKLAQYPQLMLKGVARIDRSHVEQGSTDTTNSTWALSAGVLLNLDSSNIKNSMFVGSQVGLEWQTIDDGAKDKSGVNVTLGAEAGKRWDMGSYSVANISYAPTLELLYRRYGGNIRDTFYTSGTELRFNILKFDILF
ncbi:MAG: hypothetical protein K2P81_05785 [Bacteriovoracaceae bacterium]|nr:hypothetical protein [Bacteriovoracaceae bacterium]